MNYLTKTETNELLKAIKNDNKEYSVIFKLMYIYGKDFKQIIELQWSDVNSNTIKFKGEEFPLSNENYNLLKEVNKSDKYIFFNKKEQEDIHENVNIYRKRLIYYFNNTIKQLNLSSRVKYSGLSLTDLRRLRGQHLIIDGVDLNIVMQLYQQKPNARTQFKKYLHYDELYKIQTNNHCETMQDIFQTKYTDLDIFEVKDLNNYNQYIVTNMKESTLILLDVDKLTFIEEISDNFKDHVIQIYKNNNLLDNIKGLQTSQYKLIDDCKFIKV